MSIENRYSVLWFSVSRTATLAGSAATWSVPQTRSRIGCAHGYRGVNGRCNNVVEGCGGAVGDDYSNITRLAEIGIILADLAGRLRKCNGLRNHLVHRYSSVDDAMVLGARSEVRMTLYEFIEIVERLLNEFERNWHQFLLGHSIHSQTIHNKS
ncbi:MAG TPA: DUF86 domain-containing protein [Methanosarcinales archaeon]|nr:DUF86 domain-containing protein [Methanosarcinales archaeon]